MFSHKQVWSAIDALAEQRDISVSRLARDSGLDPTTFNKSKRIAADGRLRWPSTESLAKIMKATNCTFESFAQLINANEEDYSPTYMSLLRSGFSAQPQSKFEGSQSIPLLGLAKVDKGVFFDHVGKPTEENWEAMEFPGEGHDVIYALEISGNNMLPLYRDGERIIVSTNSSIRRGDRVVVRTHTGEVLAKELARQTANAVELKSVNPEFNNRTIALQDVEWMARIIWVSQ